jgi:hypothetical protein
MAVIFNLSNPTPGTRNPKPGRRIFSVFAAPLLDKKGLESIVSLVQLPLGATARNVMPVPPIWA